jgi:hypothetical protein
MGMNMIRESASFDGDIEAAMIKLIKHHLGNTLDDRSIKRAEDKANAIATDISNGLEHALSLALEEVWKGSDEDDPLPTSDLWEKVLHAAGENLQDSQAM